jgi:hypothetical protein
MRWKQIIDAGVKETAEIPKFFVFYMGEAIMRTCYPIAQCALELSKIESELLVLTNMTCCLRSSMAVLPDAMMFERV